jgi:hypothetical protein
VMLSFCSRDIGFKPSVLLIPLSSWPSACVLYAQRTRVNSTNEMTQCVRTIWLYGHEDVLNCSGP